MLEVLRPLPNCQVKDKRLVIKCLYLDISYYGHAGQSCANYLGKIGLFYVGADSITLRSIQYFTSYGTITLISE